MDGEPLEEVGLLVEVVEEVAGVAFEDCGGGLEGLAGVGRLALRAVMEC